jgi:hypothetical protein
MKDKEESPAQRPQSRGIVSRGRSFGPVFAFPFLIGLFLLSIVSVRNADHSKPQDWLKDEMTYLPSGKYLKPMTLGYTEAAASLLWVKGVLYFGEAYLTSQSYKWMNHILDIVTTLNPHFKEAYNFGSSVLTKDKSEIQKTLPLIERGLAQFPGEWQWRVSAALARVKMDSNYLAAAEYLKPLGQDSTVPNHVRVLCATFAEKGGHESVALAYLVERHQQSKTPWEKDLFVKRIAKIRFEAKDAATPTMEWGDESTRIRVVSQILHASADAPLETLTQLLMDVLSPHPSPAARRILEKLIHPPR